MFKELGYECTEDSEEFIVYTKKYDLLTEVLSFSKEYHVVEIYRYSNLIREHFVRLDEKLVKAINQQLKEID